MIEVRRADLGDSLAVQDLLSQLGYAFAIEDVRMRLDLLVKQPVNPVLLAADADRAVGLTCPGNQATAQVRSRLP